LALSLTPSALLFSNPHPFSFGCFLEWLHSKEIPVRGKHLDDLRSIDLLCIAFSKANTAPFTYFYFRYCWILSANIPWDWRQISFTNTLLPLPALFVLFDASYCTLHWILHWQCLYQFIHKHHHIQKAPSRANVDAVNVHPIEFVLGEYNHLAVIWLWTAILGLPLHVGSAFLFVTVGGVLAGVNHTRYDIVVSIPVPSVLLLTTNKAASSSSHWTAFPIYDSKAHDVHHRIPQSNYGQYTMFWDYLFGSYRYVCVCVQAKMSACVATATIATPVLSNTQHNIHISICLFKNWQTLQPQRPSQPRLATRSQNWQVNLFHNAAKVSIAFHVLNFF
jgi:sterol desaturase/sphingolipid hydroxylase (fatty acid hydroxylase superfamily)